MGPEDQITEWLAGHGRAVTVSKQVQASRSTKININDIGDPFVGDQEDNAPAITTIEHYRATMSKTTRMQLEHLMLAAAQEPKPADLTAAKRPSNGIVNDRRPSDITLSITIKVIRSRTPISAFNITVPASKCTRWSDMRSEVIAASWEHAQVNTLNQVTFRLEEDGKAASMTIAPTMIDAQTPFPGKTYDGWYHRILRGKQTVYAVEVKIEV